MSASGLGSYRTFSFGLCHNVSGVDFIARSVLQGTHRKISATIGETNMKSLIRLVAPSLPLLLVLASGVFAQTQITTGVIQGTILDEQGGVVPGANVEVKN
jgi:hypothetical protein